MKFWDLLRHITLCLCAIFYKILRKIITIDKYNHFLIFRLFSTKPEDIY